MVGRSPLKSPGVPSASDAAENARRMARARAAYADMSRRGGALNGRLRPRTADAPPPSARASSRDATVAPPRDDDALASVAALAARVRLAPDRAPDAERPRPSSSASARRTPREVELAAAAFAAAAAARAKPKPTAPPAPLDDGRARELKKRDDEGLRSIRAPAENREAKDSPPRRSRGVAWEAPSEPSRAASEPSRGEGEPSRGEGEPSRGEPSRSPRLQSHDAAAAAAFPFPSSSSSAAAARSSPSGWGASSALHEARRALEEAAAANARLRAAAAATPAPPARTRRVHATTTPAAVDSERSSERRASENAENRPPPESSESSPARSEPAAVYAARGPSEAFHSQKRRASASSSSASAAAAARRRASRRAALEDHLRLAADLAARVAALPASDPLRAARGDKTLNPKTVEETGASISIPRGEGSSGCREDESSLFISGSARRARERNPPAAERNPSPQGLKGGFRVPTRDETLDQIRVLEERARNRHAEETAARGGGGGVRVRAGTPPGSTDARSNTATHFPPRGLRRLGRRGGAGPGSFEPTSNRPSNRTRAASDASDSDPDSDSDSDSDSAGLSPPSRSRDRNGAEGPRRAAGRRRRTRVDSDGFEVSTSEDEGEGGEGGEGFGAGGSEGVGDTFGRSPPRLPRFALDDRDEGDAEDPFEGDETGRLRDVRDFASLVAYAFD